MGDRQELLPSSGTPLYRQIKEILRQEIISGVASPDRPLTEAKLLERFGVSRAPIRQALGELADEGYVYRKQGRGTFPVESPQIQRPAGVRAGGLQRFLSSQGLKASSSVRNVARVEPPTRIRARLSLANGEELLHFERLIFVDGVPLALAAMYMITPPDFSPSAQELEAAGAAFELLETSHGIRLESAEHEAWATTATGGQAADLDVGEGDALFALETVFYTTGGVPAGHRHALHRADDFRYRFAESY